MAHPPTPATASSSSSSSDPLAGVIEALSKISADGLTILILQQPTVGRAICQALRALAKQALADVVNDDDDNVKASHLPATPFAQVLDILEEASLSSDPTLIRRLASASDVVFNLCLLAASSSSPSCSARTQRILPRLVDAAAAQDMLEAAVLALKEQTEEERGEKMSVFRAARIVAALLAYLPRPQATTMQQQRRGGAASAPSLTGTDDLASILSAAYEHASKAGQNILAAATKVALLDCASALLSRALNDDGDEGKEGRLTRIIVELSGKPSSSTSRGQSLIDFSLLADLAVARPGLCDRVGQVLRSGTAAEAQQARKALQEAQQEAGAVASSSKSLESKGAAWQTIVQHAREQRAGPSSVQPPSSAYPNDAATSTLMSTSKGKARANSPSYEPPASLLATVEAILPHLADDPVRLRKTLSRPRFRGKEEGEVVEMLLDGVGVESEDDDDVGEEEVHDVVPPPQSSAPAPAPAANRRANIFDSQPLQAAHLRYAGAADEDDTGSAHNKTKLDPSLRAAILARVQAQEAEEEEAKEEWNPFADVEGSRAREVGFEEELDQDDEDAGQRAYGGRRGYDASSSADETEDVGQSRRTSGRTTPAGPAATASSASTNSAASVASERAAERLLILAYSQHGPSLFARTNDATARRNPARKALLADLERQTGRSWDDSLVESWAVMFERNPRKGALLMAAGGGGGGGGAMLLPNSNRGGAAAAGEGGEDRGFGPDRGRGGRVLRGARGGGGGRGVRGGGAPPRGGGAGGASGHSGNDRSARRKEQRGNQQRTRGADRKARAMGGAGAGV